MTDSTRNQSIKAILDEYYEGESCVDNADPDQENVEDEFTFPTAEIEKEERKSVLNDEKILTPRQSKSNSLHAISPASSNDLQVEITKQNNGINQLNEFRLVKAHMPHRQDSKVLLDITNEGNQPNNSQSVGESNIGNPKPFSNEITHSSIKPKKPFLKRGSRKEPSSLQRVKQDVIGNGMRFKNEAKLESHSDTSEQKHLESLERMQKEQIENLERRIERREKARNEQDVIADGMGFKIEAKLEYQGNRSEQKHHKYVERNLEKKTERRGKASNDKRQNGVNQRQVKDNSEFRNKTIIQGRKPVQVPTQNEGKDCVACLLTHVTEKESYHKNSSYELSSDDDSLSSDEECPIRKQIQGATMNQAITTSPTVPDKKKDPQTSKRKGGLACGPKLKDLKTTEIKEQWQVIKSMRKRQEAALREAEKEREEVRSWASNERKRVQKWVDYQHLQIKQERKKVLNDVLSSNKKKRQQELEERAAFLATNNINELKAEVRNLSNNLKRQQLDHDTVKSRFRLNEKRLRDTISDREKTIESVKRNIDNQSASLKKMQQERDYLLVLKAEAIRKTNKKNEKNKGNSKDSTRLKHEGNDLLTEKDCPSNKCEDKVYDKEIINVKEADGRKMEENSENEDKAIEINEFDHDKHAKRVMVTRQDIVDKPTESWLKRHFQHIPNDTESSTCISSQSCPFNTSLHNKKYDPEKYSCNKDWSNETSQNNIISCPKYQDEHEISAKDYHNGTRKDILPDGTVVIKFTNGDTKTSYTNVGIVVYYYSESRTNHTTHPDGLEIFEYTTGQIERHYPNGRKEVHFPDGTQQTFLPNGDVVNSFPDGVNVMESNTGTKIIEQRFN